MRRIVLGLRALIFDMDGLLFDTERLAASTWTEAGRTLGFELTDQTVQGAIGLDHALTRSYYDKLFDGRFPFDLVEERHRALFRSRIAEQGVPKKPGVERILEEAHRKELGVALGTSSRAVYAHAMLWLGGIVDHFQVFHFQVLVTRDMVQAAKPAPDIFLKAASLLGCEPEECLVFEDSINGIRAARAAGMRVVMVPDLIEPTAELRSACHAVLPSLSDAAEALESLIEGP
jgi:HAD superfamily hydrolase (TIGR01509 family)